MKRLLRMGIALGSNQGNRMRHLQAACSWLKTVSAGPVRCSGVYETEPVGCPEGTPLFLNAVCEIVSDRDPLNLLRALRAFERQRGRPKAYAPHARRPLDMDLLYAGDLILRTRELTLPHPRMLERRFVLQPLCDLRPDLALPRQRRNVSQILAGMKNVPRVRLYEKTPP